MPPLTSFYLYFRRERIHPAVCKGGMKVREVAGIGLPTTVQPSGTDMEKYLNKIKELAEIKKEIDLLKAEGKRIVFTNGCFDILHPGHTRYLFEARKLGDYLIVALNSDSSVRTIKGSGRPIMPQEARAEVLAALNCTDGIVVFEEEDPLKVIEVLLPDVLVKGGDWAEENIIGAEVVRGAGGEIRTIPFVSGYSTTRIIKRIKDERHP